MLGHHEGAAGNPWHRVHACNVVEPAVDHLKGGHYVTIGQVSQLDRDGQLMAPEIRASKNSFLRTRVPLFGSLPATNAGMKPG
jgi:hypothetical protein